MFYFIHTIPGQLPVKDVVLVLSSFGTIAYKVHFRKVLTQIFKFGCFSWYHVYIFHENDADAKFNAKSIRTNFKYQKLKAKKLVYPFLVAVLHFETNLIK